LGFVSAGEDIEMAAQQVWDLWYPNAASQGLPFARGRLDATDRLLVHAAPDTIDVSVRNDAGILLASGASLERTGDYPMTLLTVRGQEIVRIDRWPLPEEVGMPVILPGGEVGILMSWWNAPDGSEWRWQVEFYNHR
jgi:hypothetical protein